MRNVVLQVPDGRADEFVARLAELMKDCGVSVADTAGQNHTDYVPECGDFVAFFDESYDADSDTPWIGIFMGCRVSNNIHCYGYVDNEGEVEIAHDELDTGGLLRPATDEEKERLIKSFAKIGKRWNQEEKDFEDCPTYEAIRTFEDAMSELGGTHPLVIQYMKWQNTTITDDTQSEDIDVIAFLKLRIVATAINQGWKPKFTNDECRYYPWFYIYTKEEIDAMDDDERGRVVGRAVYNAGASGGCVFAYAGSASTSSFTPHGARLAFSDRARAEYVARQFGQLWADFLFANF